MVSQTTQQGTAGEGLSIGQKQLPNPPLRGMTNRGELLVVLVGLPCRHGLHAGESLLNHHTTTTTTQVVPSPIKRLTVRCARIRPVAHTSGHGGGR